MTLKDCFLKWKRTFYIRDILLYLLFFALICLLFVVKKDYMVDELATYNLANASESFSPSDGVIYFPAEKPLLDAMTSNGVFDIRHVWKQQENDTHPPFYYVLVHAICTFFPNKISMRYAGAINIMFALLTFYLFRKILKVLIVDESVIFGLSIVFCFSAGVLEIVTLLRMYVMSMFFVSAIAYLITCAPEVLYL